MPEIIKAQHTTMHWQKSGLDIGTSATATWQQRLGLDSF